MINQQVLQGQWNEIKGQLRSHWGQLTDDDLPQFQGEVDKLVGVIQRKTGEGRDAIEHYLNELTSSAGSTVAQAADGVRQFSQRTAEFVQDSARRATDQVRSGYDQTERMVRDRPVESLAICFGVGVVTGLVLGMLVSSK